METSWMRHLALTTACILMLVPIASSAKEHPVSKVVEKADSSFSYDEATNQFLLSINTSSGRLTHKGVFREEAISGTVLIEGVDGTCDYSLRLDGDRVLVSVDVGEHGSGSYSMSEAGGVTVTSKQLTALDEYDSGRLASGIKQAFMTLNMVDRSREKAPQARVNSAMVLNLLYCMDVGRWFADGPTTELKPRQRRMDE
jgi:hypothetical protein